MAKKSGSVEQIVRKSLNGVTYENLVRCAKPANIADFDRDVLQALRHGTITIKDGRYVARSGK